MTSDVYQYADAYSKKPYIGKQVQLLEVRGPNGEACAILVTMILWYAVRKFVKAPTGEIIMESNVHCMTQDAVDEYVRSLVNSKSSCNPIDRSISRSTEDLNKAFY